MKNRKSALILAGTAAALAATLIAAAPAPAAPATPAAQAAPKPASVHGGGTIFFPYSADDDIRFTVDAVSTPWTKPFPGAEKGLPTDARGRVTISHYFTESGFTATAEAEVDCLVTGGKTASLTAVVKTSNVGWDGKRIGISVQDGQHGEPDRVGFSWAVANVDVKPDGTVAQGTVGTCMAPAPFTEVTKGGYKITPAPLAPQPKS
ncbi:hypothetical protein [Streptomyces avidinii]|uniref:Uncharacterized protein n=1 Tax=Streptomyces avidinii TaxID=1895 RepID=A0ABS4LDE3_STRAV|nr:hypothetical protein [Streptomyces avidinii]MBP2040149.1 hypothetical protein [Streptomyces avidinii]GGZ17856.1 hypothetical protein GCM10010343_51190 [Streptomyces avidinii]